jgi:threonine synthase
VLKAVYDARELRLRAPSLESLCAELGRADSQPTLLPLRSRASLPPLRIGNTPLYRLGSLTGRPLPHLLCLKDDSVNPTYSLKDRASAVVSAGARELGMQTIVAASTGNAGSSIAGVAASQGQRAVVLVPSRAPRAKLTQISLYGAAILPIDGTYDQAFDLSVELTARMGWYNRNTAFNPLTIEGKKTVAWEIARDLSPRQPDLVFVPTGDGVILAGVYRGFEDLLDLGLLERMPTVVAVQSEGSGNLVRNLGAESFVSRPSATIADSISVDIPRNFRMARRYLERFAGQGMLVQDRAILEASRELGRNAGLFAEPAAAAAFAGYLEAAREGRIRDGSTVVVLLTGSGLKDLASVQGIVDLPAPVEPTPEAVERAATARIAP